MPPVKRLISQISASTAATMKSQWTTNPATNAMRARIARTMSSSMCSVASLGVRIPSGVAYVEKTGERRRRLRSMAAVIADQRADETRQHEARRRLDPEADPERARERGEEQ